ncbi:MarR family transcriptional regulator [Leptobacterium flavescens]|uniref:MarR family transcriptional regulator n=1 Tax=Leptobacterium flavescens TaxID=472055 RepID=A0A6P0UNG3_9FLAO|nr:MarR family transcriptional regulator [Leptobacterium flavescens]NER14834.1 MarR family transcriptional regulator [Leptobacterium flavescens]
MQYDFEKTLLPWLGRITKEFSFLAVSVFENNQIDLTRHQWLLLKKLNDKDGQPQNDLAFITDRDKTSLTRLINTMERKELVKRVPDATDRRINLVYLTQKGREILEKSIPIMKELIGQMQNGLSTEELENTITALKKVKANLENIPQEKNNRLK